MRSGQPSYDVVVIGGGHAGAEAAHAAARLGCRTALVTMRAEAIGRMSCNPAIGGLGKGQMVREIDALGGLMGRVIDATGIQFRMLNRSKGPAVWAPRAQADRELYAAELHRLLRETPNLDIIEGAVDELLVRPAKGSDRGEYVITSVRLAPFSVGQFRSGSSGSLLARPQPRRSADDSEVGRYVGNQTFTAKTVPGDGRELSAKTVVITTGTFLRGLMHCGERQTAGGRVGERAADALSDGLARLGFELGRLKTGTPPRIHRGSIDYKGLQPQPGDSPPAPFSFMTGAIDQPQIQCWITHTNPDTHALIRANLHRAPMYSGQIRSHGPRYCPSIEDKVVRFADKPRHQVFLEPEGYDNERVYCNGISTSLPPEVQEGLVRTITGLERAKILQAGYAVEYDWVPTHQIDAALETRRVEGLFLAGQINGTSGYEEAAGQGLMAGLNAAHKVLGREPVVLRRDQAYIGVMIDDLVTCPPDEPYRMFTSRAEYRLRLRSDNADARLTPVGRDVGLVDDARWEAYQAKQEQIAWLETALAGERRRGRLLIEQLRRPDVRVADLVKSSPQLRGRPIDPAVAEQVEIRAKYAGYLQRQDRQIQRLANLEAQRIPEGFEFGAIAQLRVEAREKLARFAPRTLRQASRIHGVSPADLAVLWVHLHARRSGADHAAPSRPSPRSA